MMRTVFAVAMGLALVAGSTARAEAGKGPDGDRDKKEKKHDGGRRHERQHTRMRADGDERRADQRGERPHGRPGVCPRCGRGEQGPPRQGPDRRGPPGAQGRRGHRRPEALREHLRDMMRERMQRGPQGREGHRGRMGPPGHRPPHGPERGGRGDAARGGPELHERIAAIERLLDRLRAELREGQRRDR